MGRADKDLEEGNEQWVLGWDLRSWADCRRRFQNTDPQKLGGRLQGHLP